MSYYIDEHAADLDTLQERLQSTDLIPSQEPLLDGIVKKIASIKRAGVSSLADLRSALETEKSLTLLAGNSGVDASYLKLLRRAVNGFFPKPRSLKTIDWLEPDAISSLDRAGIKNTQHFFDAASGGLAVLTRRVGIDQEDAQELQAISDLSRIQWVSPTFARVIVAAGFTNAAAVADAEPEELFARIAKANQDATFYKGKVGLRDIRRLVAAAAYVP